MGGTPRQQRATSYFAGAIGGASEMTLLSEREGARTDLVAAAHSLRLLIVVLVIPFAFSSAACRALTSRRPAPGWRNGRAWRCWLRPLALGAWVMQRLGRANPWFMGALVVSMGLTMAACTCRPSRSGWSTRPSW
jgi:uncharacterized membrane protein AbrB (regulator of aidB expression)